MPQISSLLVDEFKKKRERKSAQFLFLVKHISKL